MPTIGEPNGFIRDAVPAGLPARYTGPVAAFRLLLISIFAALAGAIGGTVLAGGSIHHLGPVMFVAHFTLLGSVGLLAPAYAIMKFAEVPRLRRYAGLVSFGALAGAIILLPLDLVTEQFVSAPLGACFGGVTGAFWVFFHAASRAVGRISRAPWRQP